MLKKEIKIDTQVPVFYIDGGNSNNKDNPQSLYIILVLSIKCNYY
jgi:hypothetical protein